LSLTRRAQAAQPALVDGDAALVWAPDGQPRVVFHFTFADGKISGIELVADQERIRDLDLILE
jgi:RNA polymerase sigma-70 factor (ECF subfamily)